MDFTDNTLPTMVGSVKGFRDVFHGYATAALWPAMLIPKLSTPRLEEAHGSWLNDLDRVGSNEPNLAKGLDHFKQAGHLAFWLRRLSPLIEAIDATDSLQDAGSYGLDKAGIAFRDLLKPYANEYLAFDLGYQIINYYEHARKDRKAVTVKLNNDYYQTVCHFMKFKNVSPHALHLIYKSLFWAT